MEGGRESQINDGCCRDAVRYLFNRNSLLLSTVRVSNETKQVEKRSRF